MPDPPGAQKGKRGRDMKKKNVGSTFDTWLREEGFYEEVSATAIKRVVARQVEAATEQKGPAKRNWPGACTPAAPLLTFFSIPTTMP